MWRMTWVCCRPLMSCVPVQRGSWSDSDVRRKTREDRDERTGAAELKCMSCRALIDYKTEECLYEGKAKGRKARATSTTLLKSMSVEPIVVSSTTCTHTCSLHSGSEYVCVCMEHAGTSTCVGVGGRHRKGPRMQQHLPWARPAHAAASSLGSAHLSRACPLFQCADSVRQGRWAQAWIRRSDGLLSFPSDPAHSLHAHSGTW